MSTRIVAVVFAAIVLGACSLYGGLDGFSSSGGPEDVSDGAPAVDSTVTAPDDASAADDGGTTSDAGSNDAAADARYCTTPASDDLCADFDDPSNPLAIWTKTATATSDVVLATSGALSAPHALRASAGAAGSNRHAFMTRNVGTASVDRARLSYALYVEQRPQVADLEVNGLVFAATNNNEFYLAIAPNGNAYIVEQSADPSSGAFQTNYHDIGSSIPTGQWVRVVLEVTLAGSAKELVLSVDGTERARKALTLTGPGVPRVRAGITWVDKTAVDGVVIVDDIRFDVLP